LGLARIELGEKQIKGTGYMVSKVEAPSSGLAVAIPLHVVRDVSSEIEEKGKVERGWLGVLTREDEEGHLYVIEVTPDSPAEEAGLEEGDIIIELENMAVSGGEMLLNEVRSHKPGETVTLRIDREGKTQRVKVKLGEYTEQDIWREFEVKFPSLFNIPESQAFPEQMPRPFRFPFEGRIPKVGVWRPFESQKFIGVTLDTLDEGLSEFFGLKEGVGKNGPADKAGIKVGDLIVKADGKRVETTDELVKMIHEKEKGETINLEILRDKKKMTVEVEIDEDESLMSAVPFEHWEQSVKKWGNASENAWKQASGSSNWYFDEYRKTMEKFREEMKKLSETFLHEIKERSQETRFFWPTLI
jgi:serine protease Do